MGPKVGSAEQDLIKVLTSIVIRLYSEEDDDIMNRATPEHATLGGSAHHFEFFSATKPLEIEPWLRVKYAVFDNKVQVVSNEAEEIKNTHNLDQRRYCRLDSAVQKD